MKNNPKAVLSELLAWADAAESGCLKDYVCQSHNGSADLYLRRVMAMGNHVAEVANDDTRCPDYVAAVLAELVAEIVGDRLASLFVASESESSGRDGSKHLKAFDDRLGRRLESLRPKVAAALAELETNGPSREALLADLESLRQDFWRLFATDVECALRTRRNYWPSRSLVPTPIRIEQARNDGDRQAVMGGVGVTIEPTPVRSIDEAERAPVYYDAGGNPIANAAGQSMILAPGWESWHEIKLRGPGCVRAQETIRRANDWAIEAAGHLAAMLWPGESLSIGKHAWADVVDRAAELANRATLRPSDWRVTAGRQSYSLTVWRRRSAYPILAEEIGQAGEAIGDDPESIWAERAAFLRDSELAAQWLIERLSKQADEPEAVADDTESDGLSTDGRTLHWGGKAYSVGPGAVGVIRLLIDAYRSGKPYLSQAYLMAEGDCETEIRTLVKNNKLDGVLVRQKKPDSKLVKGMWGLVDPDPRKKKLGTR